MRVCAVMKYPPIQGGVSVHGFWIARALAIRGHQVYVVTNADEVELDYRVWMPAEDRHLLGGSFPGGGSVTVVGTAAVGRQGQDHIPWSNPYATKLAALASDTILQYDCELVFAYYLEPYGVAGHLAASWTNRPLVLQHAGSDRKDLLSDPDLVTAYREVIRRADLVIGPPITLEGFGVSTSATSDLPPPFLPGNWGESANSPVDLEGLVTRLAVSGNADLSNTKPPPSKLPVILVYGKVGESKGHFELVRALARIAEAGGEFSLVAPVGGRRRSDLAELIQSAGLDERTWLLPFLPHWWVPHLLGRATATCFLEHDFPVGQHRPQIPTEVMAAGGCLVLSGEVARKQIFRHELRHGENVVLVHNPQDQGELLRALSIPIDEPAAATGIGAAARSVPKVTHESGLADAYERYFETALARRDGARRARSEADVPRAVTALVRRHMPATFRLLGDRLPSFLEQICDAAQPAHRIPHVAMAVADALQHLAEEHPRSTPPHTAEVVAFERDILWLHVDIETGVLAMFPPSGVDGLQLSDSLRIRVRKPVRSNWLRLGTHRADIARLVEEVHTGNQVPPQTSSEATATFLMIKKGDLSTTVRRVNSATVALLSRCDGLTDVAEILDWMSREYDCAEKSTLTVLRSLVDQRVLRL